MLGRMTWGALVLVAAGAASAGAQEWRVVPGDDWCNDRDGDRQPREVLRGARDDVAALGHGGRGRRAQRRHLGHGRGRSDAAVAGQGHGRGGQRRGRAADGLRGPHPHRGHDLRDGAETRAIARVDGQLPAHRARAHRPRPALAQRRHHPHRRARKDGVHDHERRRDRQRRRAARSTGARRTAGSRSPSPARNGTAKAST